MKNEKPPELRLVEGDPWEASISRKPRARASSSPELVGETGLLRPDQLENVRTRALGGSFSQALRDEGLATALGVARTLAEQYHLPLVDLAEAGIDPDASKLIALPVLERVGAIPFAFEDGTLKIAITDPQNVQGLDQLRLATRHSVEFFVAASTDVLTEVKRLTRASEALNASLVEDAVAEAAVEEGGGRPRGRRRHLRGAARPARQLDHLPGRRGGRQRRPLRAAGGRARRPLPDRRRASRRAADPHAPDRGRDDPPQGSREARHRRAAQASGRAHLAERRRRRPHARHPRRHAADRRRRGRDDAPPRQVPERADARGAGLSDEMRDQLSGIVSKPTGSPARHRADRLGQVDDALRRARRDQPAGGQHHHGRGPGRVPARRHQPGPDQPARRA